MRDLDSIADQLFYQLFEVPDNDTDNTETDDEPLCLPWED